MILPDGPVRLENVTVPACLLGQTGDLVRTSLSVADGRVAASGGTPVDMKGAMVFPAFVDMHTHLDKGHIWPRTPNPDGTFMGALTAVGGDREASWSAEDVRARMDFALRCAYAHGTRAIRTHLDSIPPQDDISWAVFREMRAEWAGRIELQAACLVACENVEADGPFAATADTVAAAGGVLGMVTYPVPTLQDRLDTFFRLAADRGLSADFHVDETMDPAVEHAAPTSPAPCWTSGSTRPSSSAIAVRCPRCPNAMRWPRWTLSHGRASTSSACRSATSTCRTASPPAPPATGGSRWCTR